MGWGPTIEAPDPAALARFYAELLEWPIGHEEPGTTVLAAPEGSVSVVFQQADDHRPPVWPPAEQVIAHTNLYWRFQAAPGRRAGVVDADDVAFSS